MISAYCVFKMLFIFLQCKWLLSFVFKSQVVTTEYSIEDSQGCRFGNDAIRQNCKKIVGPMRSVIARFNCIKKRKKKEIVLRCFQPSSFLSADLRLYQRLCEMPVPVYLLVPQSVRR